MKKLLLLPLLMITCFCFAQDAKAIIGKPIRIGNFLVAQYDFPKLMTWEDAKAACANLGEGWALPTKNELNFLYENREKIGGFASNIYWSSTEYSYGNAWGQRFTNGDQGLSYGGNEYAVRSIRSL